MKDYSVLNGMISNHTSEMRTAYDKGYKQGMKDIDDQFVLNVKVQDAYKKGMDDIWGLLNEFLDMMEGKRGRIFHTARFQTLLKDYTPQRAMKLLSESREKTSDDSDNSKIEVGDVVKRADIDKSVVIIKFTEEGWALGMNEEGNISDVKLSIYKKTGKHFEQIAEVFNSLKDDTDA